MGYYFYDFLGYFLIIVASIITLLAEYYVRSNYGKYKKIISKNKMSGQEVARLILDSNGLDDVYVIEISGVLTDYYDPNRKVVKLSSEVFHGNSISSIAVASHEVCHAIQDKEGYAMLRLRGAIFPYVSFASKFGYLAIFLGFIFGYLQLAWFGVTLLGVILLFQLVTLPVEFDASRRALKIIKDMKILNSNEMDCCYQVLKAAAFTYVASLVTTILELLRLIILINGRDDN